jgi:hypothetical protein
MRNEYNLAKVTIEIDKGCSIREAFLTAIKACLDFGCDIDFEFNGHKERVNKEDVIEFYNTVTRKSSEGRNE